MSSNVGSHNIYEDGDQKNVPVSERNERDRFHEGQPHSHLANDSKDERSIANKLAREGQREKEGEAEPSFEVLQSKKDSTLPAKSHGNEPSKGAKVDQEIEDEEAEILKKKGAWGSKQ
ncbi:hypothetical protein K431DRAFT_273507 [Polychaeton citri CBS 116435]|uniref:Uncharacterized protein n=1 Tax=Polychaeton citri CBS 116435 TaxID=1314669 RepID=A0A9P4Q6T9_9PEZI|nr:hypothetical protein K431DRAFT_273507 [Polychaeton citri CBS 116435]